MYCTIHIVWCGVIDRYIKVKKGLNPTNFLALVIGMEKKLIPSDVIGGVNAGLYLCVKTPSNTAEGKNHSDTPTYHTVTTTLYFFTEFFIHKKHVINPHRSKTRDGSKYSFLSIYF